MVWACTTARRGQLCQMDLGGKCRWITEQRNTEKERWIDVVKYNKEDLQLNVEDAANRAEWKNLRG